MDNNKVNGDSFLGCHRLGKNVIQPRPHLDCFRRGHLSHPLAPPLPHWFRLYSSGSSLELRTDCPALLPPSFVAPTLADLLPEILFRLRWSLQGRSRLSNASALNRLHGSRRRQRQWRDRRRAMIAKANKLDSGKETREKKKKKKARAVEEDALDMEPLVKTKPSQNSVASSDMVQEISLLKKKKKKKKKKVQESENLDRAPHEESEEAEPKDTIRSLKKHQSMKELLPNPSELPCQEKRKKTKPSLDLTSSYSPGAEAGVGMELEEDFVRKHKKQKKDKRSDQERSGEQEPKEALPDPMEEEEGKEGEPIEQGQIEEKQEPSNLRDSGAKKKKKKKKKTYREEEEDEEDRTDNLPTDEAHIEDSSAIGSYRKKGHKNKKTKAEPAEHIPLPSSPRNIEKKGKKSKIQTEPPPAEEPAPKKKKKTLTTAGRKVMQDPKGPGMGHESDLEVVSEKKGNLDEVTIDTVRRKALQEEIDRESGKTEALETKVEAPTRFGQWDTATFENSDQKMKFLRLMGGFKNSSSALSSSPGTLGKPNMALNKQAAATLQQNLQVEFDRAMSWKQQRGVGLGYSASANKNKLFYIDRNASRSVKFDD
ncbi:lysine-rich nucleolar protein 1 [Monodelphis domestica]|uniref:lysine-rich nucleolar protein 1 n=1 Tax=Monodelphis domestica TaxID=13616 RepID=UPI0024E21EF3|nr:lysine-rich nucleolar protein 1 [Monodelphis domestica]